MIAELIGFGIDPEVRKYLDRTNMQVAKYCSLVFIAVRFFGFTSGLFTIECWIPLLVTAGLFLFSCIYFKKKERIGQKWIGTIMSLYAVAEVGYALFYTLAHYPGDGTVAPFFVVVVMLCGLFVFPVFFMIPLVTGAYAILMVVVASRIDLPTEFYWQLGGGYLCLLLLIFVRHFEKMYIAKKVVEVNRISYIDTTTGLKNRRAAEADAKEYVNHFLYMVNVRLAEYDFFQRVYGNYHLDEILRQIGSTLAKVSDVEYRYYMENGVFTLVYQESSIPAMKDVIAYIRQNARKVHVDGEEFFVTLQIQCAYGSILKKADLWDMERVLEARMVMTESVEKEDELFFDYDQREDGEIPEIDLEKQVHLLDSLTGLAGLSLFRYRAVQLLSIDTESDYYVLYFDIANFKSYNEKFGFQSGDRFLKQVAEILSEEFAGQLISRFSADQFVILTELPDFLQRILKACLLVRNIRNDAVMDLKVGIYRVRGEELDISICCDRAKLACNSIKNTANQYYRFFDEDFYKEVRDQRYIVEHLDEAIREGYLKVYYQPVMRTITNHVCGYEALARWEDPNYGMIFPGQFIPVLEDRRLIYRLDSYIIQKVCEDLHHFLQDHGNSVPVSVNLSRLDFQLCDVPDVVEKNVLKYGIDRNKLHIEVTESALMDNPEFLDGELNKLRKLGYQIWMDDFGSGYSSLNILKDYQFDTLKTDMEFLRHYEENPRAKEVLMSVVDMTKRLGIEVLAEGVETKEQLDFLTDIGVEKVQGFYFDCAKSYGEVVNALVQGNVQFETPRERESMEKIGALNFLSPDPLYLDAEESDSELVTKIPIAILKYSGGNYEYMMMSAAYLEVIKSVGLDPWVPGSGPHNLQNNAIRRQYDEFLRHAMETGKEEKLDYIENGNLCTSHVRYITDLDTQHVFAVTLTNNVKQGDGEDRFNRLIQSMVGVYGIFERIDYFNQERGLFQNLYQSKIDRDEELDYGKITDAGVQRFAEKYIVSEEQQDFCEFYNRDRLKKAFCEDKIHMSHHTFHFQDGYERGYYLVPMSNENDAEYVSFLRKIEEN